VVSVTAPRSERVRDGLLIGLTFSAGAVDALCWMALGKVFSAFMTGNLVFLGIDAAGVPGPSVPRVLVAVAAFAIGAVLGARIVAPTRGNGDVWPSRVTVALGAAAAAQVVFLGIWLVVDGRPSDLSGHALIGISALAMGMQTSAVFSLGVRAVFTTAATATLAVLMGDLATWSSTRAERRRLAGVIVGLFAGALAGAYLVAHARSWAPVLPLAVTAAVVGAATLHGAGERA
jgi:uncharacterized membrane protein YoaK (UPF0700 family)